MEQVRRRRKRKKKSYKKALWITLASLVIVGGGGWGGFYYVTHRDVEAADIGVEEDFFDFSSFTDDSLIGGGTPGTEVATGSDVAGSDAATGTTGTSGGDTAANPAASGTPSATDAGTTGTGQTGKPDAGGDAATSNPSNTATSTDTSGNSSNNGSNGTNGGTTATEQPAENTGSSTDKPASNTGTTTPSPPVAVDPKTAIENKYSSVLQQLQGAALSKLDTLAANAVGDYQRGRSVTDISSTYMSAANKLQSAVDGAFDAQVSRMRAELKGAGFSTEAADKAEAAYAAAVSAKKSEMMSKAEQLAGL